MALVTEEETARYWQMSALLDDATNLADHLTAYVMDARERDRARREIQNLREVANGFRL